MPEGFCYSVRLGNWVNDARQESITYTIHVDTERFDLLILNYALVEEQSGHNSVLQPRFEFDIFDSLGQSISNCYHGNFISGDMSGWNRGMGSFLWRDF